MVAATLMNLSNTPRDYEGIMKMLRPIRFRIALQMGLPSTADKEGFAQMSDESQSQELLAAVTIHDDPNQNCPCNFCEKARAEGGPAAQPESSQPVQPTPVAAATPMAQPQPGVQPQPGTPAVPPASPAFAPPPPQQQAPQQAPPQQAAAQQQPGARAPQEAVARAPVTQAQVAQAAGPPAASPVQKLLEGIQKQQKKILGELEGCAGVAELEELKELNLGMARMMNVMCLVLLDLSSAVMEISKEDLITMANVGLQQGEPEKFFAQEESAEGN